MTSPIFSNNPPITVIIDREFEDMKRIASETKIALQVSAIDTHVENIAPRSEVTPAVEENIHLKPLIERTIVPYFDMLNYQAQTSIFNDLDTFTEGTDRLRGPAFIAWSTSSAIGIATRILSIAEVTIHGLGLLFITQFSEDSIACIKKKL